MLINLPKVSLVKSNPGIGLSQLIPELVLLAMTLTTWIPNTARKQKKEIGEGNKKKQLRS